MSDKDSKNNNSADLTSDDYLDVILEHLRKLSSDIYHEINKIANNDEVERKQIVRICWYLFTKESSDLGFDDKTEEKYFHDLYNKKYSDKNLKPLARALYMTEFVISKIYEIDKSRLSNTFTMIRYAQQSLGNYYGIIGAEITHAEKITMNAIRAAKIRHKTNHNVREQAIKEFITNRDKFSSKEQAAKTLGKKFSRSSKTVRKWLCNK